MAKKIKVKQSVLDWCIEETSRGNELALIWDGGGDSGWVGFQINEVDTNNDYTEYLTDMMYAELDYGSWAGEFQASGKAIFNPDEKAFVGVDYYSEEETYSQKCKIPLEIPKSLWFDSISIQIEADDEDTNPHVQISFNITNGFLTDEHDEVANKLSEFIEEETNNVINEFMSTPGSNGTYRGMWDSIVLNKEEFEEKDNHYKYIVEELDIRAADVSEKDIYLYIDEDETLPEKND